MNEASVALVVFAAALVLAAATALVWRHLHPRVVTPADIRRITGLPVVAQLPAAALGTDDLDDRPASRRMRTALREAIMNTVALSGGALPARIVVARTDSVAEAAGVDGGLARALAESGHAAALVETDLDSRMLSQPSDISESPLDGDSPRRDAGGYEREPVPDRVASARPAERLARVDALLSGLGDRYDVTVAQAASDSHPVPLRSLAPVADVVLIVARSGRTTVEALLALQAELLSVGVRPLGVVLTGTASRHRVLLRSTWGPEDFRSAAAADPAARNRVSDPAPAPFAVTRTAGFSIADLAAAAGTRRSPASVSREDES